MRPESATRPLWPVTTQVPEYEPLTEDALADVAVIGAGIAGLTVAYELCLSGKQVIVLEDGELASGETSRTTAHLSNEMDDRYTEIEKVFGDDGARVACQSHAEAIDRIEAIAREEQIDCDFERVDGWLVLGRDQDMDLLKNEAKAARNAGMRGALLVDCVPGLHWRTGPAIIFPHQAQFNPLKYIAGLARAVVRRGGQIHCHSKVVAIGRQKRDGIAAPIQLHTKEDHLVEARALVVCTNSPINDLVAMHTKQSAYRTYVVGLRVPPGVIPHMLIWDTEDPYHYVRLQRAEDGDSEILIVGGEDHKTGQANDAEERWRRLESWTRERFPMCGEVAYRWSGQVMEPVDYMGFIGRNPGDDNVYIVTGDSGQGMTHGTLAGRLITDLILGRLNAWSELYDPGRISIRTAPEYLRENLNVAEQYTDWIKRGDASSADEIAPGTGALLRQDRKIIAAYRDDEGVLHELSAVCTHLKCIVQWNAAEKSWDCPCHGSRFGVDGHVLNGPAVAGLERIESEVKTE